MDKKDDFEYTQETSNQTYSKPLDYFYPEDYKEKDIITSDLPATLLKYHTIIGQDFLRRYNYHFFNDTDMLIANANSFQIINIKTFERKIFHSTEIGGIGSVTIHPNKTYFAIAECGELPNIYIYEYPSIKLYRILRKGTEKGYSTISFNSKGDQLASVGTDPDYNLVIWNWMNESIILKAKAFSQEIFKVEFSSNIEGKLITSGIGHIRFWEMANTFTGLKLQGELGKFGQIDLSDISAFVEFPDGKVLSGTEYGTFLLWEGIFIKAHLMIEDKKNCHQGLIEYMAWDTTQTKYVLGFNEKYIEEVSAKIKSENRNTDDYFESQEKTEKINLLISKIEIPEKVLCILTGGYDGYLKWWIFTDLENAIIDDNSNAFIIPAKEKLLINPITDLPVKIINLVKLQNFWVIQDGNGYLLKLTQVIKSEDFEFQIENIYNFNSGPVVKTKQLFPSPYLLIQGMDANTFLYNLNSKNFLGEKILLESDPELKAICCDIANRESNLDLLILAIGYDIGLLRIYQFDSENLKMSLLTQLRAHDENIKKVLFSPDKSYLMTLTLNEIFIFIIDDYHKIIPFCCIKKEQQIIDIDWHLESKKFLLGLSDGSVEEIEIPLNFDNSKTFVMSEYKYKKFFIKFAESQLDKEDEKAQRRKNDTKKRNEPGPSPILSCKYVNLYKEGDFLLTAKKPYNEFLYICCFTGEYFIENAESKNFTPRPFGFWKLPKAVDYFIKNISKNFLVLCNNKGYTQIRHKTLMEKYVEIFPNSYSGIVTDISLSEDEKLISISFKDGTIINYLLNIEKFNEIIEGYKNDPYFFDPTKLEFNEVNPPSFVSEENPIEILKSIKTNEYELNDLKLSTKKKDELEEMISLEKEKKDAEEQDKLKKAEETKNQTRLKVKRLRDEFQKVLVQNSALNEEVRLTDEELVVDEQYLEFIKKNNNENLDDIKHKYDWFKANIHVTIDKIKSFFLDSVKTTKIYVFALQTDDYVNTLRCPNLPGDFKEKLSYLNNEIEELQRRIDFDVLENEYKKYMPNDDQKNDNVHDIENILHKIKNRIHEYKESEKETEGGMKRADSNKNAIKTELEFTNENLAELAKIIDDKKGAKEKIIMFKDELKEKGKKDKNRANRNSTVALKSSNKCPDSYSLKINYDKCFTEQNMLTTLIHKKRIYDFLSILYEERENFNTKVLNLRKKKIELIKKLKDLKEKLIEINQELEADENFDWLDFSFKEKMEFPETEFQVQKAELDLYVSNKAKNDKEISKIIKALKKDEAEPEDKSNNNQDILLFKDRVSKKKNESVVQSEFRSINLLKFEYKKHKLLNECRKLIKDFDEEVYHIKNLKLTTAFKQKLGEFELLIKHEEFSILRAFESEDLVLIKNLELLCYDYTDNCNNLKNCYEGILSNEEALDKASQGREAKIREFHNLIIQEKESKAKLEKIFYQKSKRAEARDGGDDKMENDDEGEDSRPKNINNQLYSEIINLKDLRENYDADIEKLKRSIALSKKTREQLSSTKHALDRKKGEIRNKINANERKKSRYLNLIDITIPLKLDKFCKFQPRTDGKPEILKLSLDISKAVLISDHKSKFLENLLNLIRQENIRYEEQINQFKNKFLDIDKEIKDVLKKKQDLDTNFKNEQILKFGIVIKFENLLKASKDTIVDKLEQDYKNLKRDVDVFMDKKKYELEENKKDLQTLVNENTSLLKNIKDLLEKNKEFDITLEEKNNEINQKDGRKYSMYNIKEKKLKLKEILNLLEQQMKALKKEIDIFRKKGGHIYSTIISNLN